MSWILRASVLCVVCVCCRRAYGAEQTEKDGFKSDYKNVCFGTRNGMGAISRDQPTPPTGVRPDGETGVQRLYRQYKERYQNCTYVEGNLEIVSLMGDLTETSSFELDFLKDIEEVTGYVLIAYNAITHLHLNRLRLIRGEILYTDDTDVQNGTEQSKVRQGPTGPSEGGYSLFISLNYRPNSTNIGLFELQMTSLREIMAGDVLIHTNNLLCHENSVNWRDILTGHGAKVVFRSTQNFVSNDYERSCPACHAECNGTCWGAGSDMCQTLTRVRCATQCDGRCYGNQPDECCNVECAAGCYGASSTQCLGCKNFIDEGRCVTQCPPPRIYGSNLVLRDNPNGKYMYGRQCVKQCPPNYIAFKDAGACVSDCGIGRHLEGDGKCVDDTQCVGYCPKKCYIEGSDFLHEKNIDNLLNCSILVGGLKIVLSTFKGDPYRNVPRMSADRLQILQSLEEITDAFWFDAHLPDKMHDLSFLSKLRAIHGHHLADYDGVVLKIHGSKLKSLGLKSLRQIGHGKIHIVENHELCYADTVNWTAIRAVDGTGTELIRNNKNRTKCERRHHVCSPLCTDDGCWGPGDDQCVACRQHRLGDRCLQSCSSVPGFYVRNGTSDCGQCHDECRETINACHGPNAGDCTGCKHYRYGTECVDKCPVFVLDDRMRPFPDCLPPGKDHCDPGTFEKHVSVVNRSAQHRACVPCHPQCRTCYGSDSSDCDGDCVEYVQDGGDCVTDCSLDHFLSVEKVADRPGRCVACHASCDECTGPTAADCVACRVYTIFGDFENRNLPDAPFNCSDECPVDAEYKLKEDKHTVCVPDEFVPLYTKRQAVIISAGVIGSVIIISIVLLVVMLLRRQLAKVQEKNLQLTARITGVVECEPLTPGKAQPDMSVLRLIKESDLRRGDVIGSGAFGTVYKGFWCPEGENIKIPVAIKVLQDSSASSSMLDEARIMASVLHPCCTHVLAVCLASQVMLVTQLMPLGCLLYYVRKNRSNVGSKALLNWSTQIARGMAYLESRNIIHRDLAARNVLVHSPNHVKITDFGLAKLVSGDESFQSESCKMPIKWLALECIRNRAYSHKSDVWSFGVTLWELFTYGERPYELIRATDIVELLEKGERLAQPAICTIDVYMIMIKCWMLDADSRPSFTELATEFAKMARDPGRYLVIPNDALMRLPSQTSSTEPGVPWYVDTRGQPTLMDDGPEQVVLADEYVNQRLGRRPGHTGRTWPGGVVRARQRINAAETKDGFSSEEDEISSQRIGLLDPHGDDSAASCDEDVDISTPSSTAVGRTYTLPLADVWIPSSPSTISPDQSDGRYLVPIRPYDEDVDISCPSTAPIVGRTYRLPPRAANAPRTASADVRSSPGFGRRRTAQTNSRTSSAEDVGSPLTTYPGRNSGLPSRYIAMVPLHPQQPQQQQQDPWRHAGRPRTNSRTALPAIVPTGSSPPSPGQTTPRLRPRYRKRTDSPSDRLPPYVRTNSRTASTDDVDAGSNAPSSSTTSVGRVPPWTPPRRNVSTDEGIGMFGGSTDDVDAGSSGPSTSGVRFDRRRPPPAGDGSKPIRLKEIKLPLDRTDYLQPQSSVPATYLDLTDEYRDHNDVDDVQTPQVAPPPPPTQQQQQQQRQQLKQQHPQQYLTSRDAVANPEYFGMTTSSSK